MDLPSSAGSRAEPLCQRLARSERLALSARHTVLLIGIATLGLDLRAWPAMPIPVTPDRAQSAAEKMPRGEALPLGCKILVWGRRHHLWQAIGDFR